MAVDIWDHEGNANAIYAQAKADPSEPPGPHHLAMGLGVAIRYDHQRLLGGAKYARVNGEEFIFVRRGLSPLVEGMRIYHELAERHLRSARGVEDVERACDELAYHLRMPRAAFRSLVATVGTELDALAKPWPATQTGAALRYLEVLDVPGVVVTPRDVRPRGPTWVWPAAGDVRRLARCRVLPDGLDRVRITDRPGSALLIAS